MGEKETSLDSQNRKYYCMYERRKVTSRGKLPVTVKDFEYTYTYIFNQDFYLQALLIKSAKSHVLCNSPSTINCIIV